MLVTFSKWLLVATLSLSLGAHWAVLQSVAWAGMVVNYASAESWQQAVTKTFDGKHPCPICKLVRAGKSAEKQSESQQSLKKLDLFADGGTQFHFPPAPEIQFALVPILSQRSEAPIPPPPRSFLG